MKNNFAKNNNNIKNQTDEMVVDLRSLLKAKNASENKDVLKSQTELVSKLKLEKKPKNKTKKELKRGLNIKSVFLGEKKNTWNFKLDKTITAPDLSKLLSYRKKKKLFLKVLKNRERILAAKIKHFNFLPKIKVVNRKKEARRIFFWSRLPAFVFILIILVLPLKLFTVFTDLDFKNLEDKILNNSFGGVNNLLAAADSLAKLDFKDADTDVKAAGLSFLKAQQELDKINSAIFSLASLSNDPKIKLASQGPKFLAAGVLASSLAENLLLATNSLFNTSQDFSEGFENFITQGRLAVEDAKELKKILYKIDANSLPSEYQAKFEDLKNKSTFLFDNLDEFIKSADKLKDFLGLSTDKRYLLIFQNNSELRASGGFMGSYALVDLRQGKIKNLEVPAGGTYDLEAGLKGKKFAPPYPLTLVNSVWNFWDANWWPDWPKTAKHLMWFYEQSSGPSVDAVISLTPTVIERVLEITGPIDMTRDYGIIINAENFWETVQKVVEYKNLEISHPESLSEISAPSSSSPVLSDSFSATLPLKQDLENNPDHKPKKIIGDLMARIIEILPEKINQENLPAIISLFSDSSSQKQILFYFKDEKAQAELSRFGLTGEVKDSDHDYLMVVDTNIAGQKTDKVMEKNISLVSQIDDQGEIINKLTIIREHKGIKREALVGVRNVNWLRVYVPAGAELLSASGFAIPDESFFDEPDEDAILVPELKAEAAAKIDPVSQTRIYEEEGKRVFANWTMTDPGESSVIEISYRLPFNFYQLESKQNNSWWQSIYNFFSKEMTNVFPYSLLLQKQPGARSFPFTWKMELPENSEIFWQKENQEAINKKYLFEIYNSLDQDYFYGALIKKLQD